MIVDSQGRLFGKVSILDLGAGLVLLLVLVGIFIFPGPSGSVAQLGSTTKAVEVDVIARGLSTSDPTGLLKELQTSKKINIVIRNQPYGQVDLKSVRVLPRTTAVAQPDGSVKALKDPRPELDLSTDLLLTLGGQATLTSNGPVLGNSKVKVGTPVQLEGLMYDFNGSIVDVRIKE
ncbi:MAG: DUF4330 domain-containing protein [Leptolyngbyaceae bacterium]|nr:DUF4330 domain-containing protein [Leptolyngbyaceae bacterium]